MTEEENKKLQQFVQGKWVNGCPMCGSRTWDLVDTFYSMMEFNGSALMVGKVQPVIPIVCSNCGNVQYLSAVVSGIIKSLKK